MSDEHYSEMEELYREDLTTFSLDLLCLILYTSGKLTYKN